MGKEKDKKPLFGGIFQKFFKPSAKAEAKKKKEHHLTVQRSIPYLEMGRDGICRVEEHLYSKTVRFYDINYQLAQNEDKNTIFESWCDFLNYFDSSIRFQLSFINHKSDMSELRATARWKITSRTIPVKSSSRSRPRAATPFFW